MAVGTVAVGAAGERGAPAPSSDERRKTRSFSCLPRRSLDCSPTTNEIASIRLDLPAAQRTRLPLTFQACWVMVDTGHRSLGKVSAPACDHCSTAIHIGTAHNAASSKEALLC